MPIDFERLRNLLRLRIMALANDGTHKTLPQICLKLGLPPPPSTDAGSKAERMAASFTGVGDPALPGVAERILEFFPPEPADRNRIQDVLWQDSDTVRVPKRYRRELAEQLAIDDLIHECGRFESLLDRLWVLDDVPFAEFIGTTSLRSRIQRHVFRNPGDWSVDDLFEHLGVFECTDHRFGLFLEGLVSAEILTSEPAQRRLATKVNDALAQCGVELREVGEDEGYPVFRFVSKADTRLGKPKNLIFASSIKPDLRFRDAINNDIEIVSNASEVLVYDRPIGPAGLCWSELQKWWEETTGTSDSEKAKKGLYRRLKESLPANSPPQHRFFEAYFRQFGRRIPQLPALLPEVWLHWDPKTVKERGANALTRFRMDFLLLLPGGHRIVVEVDGKQHYAEGDVASPTKFATMVAADRDLRLAGYEVYRFGGAELSVDSTDLVVSEFQGCSKFHLQHANLSHKHFMSTRTYLCGVCWQDDGLCDT